jgi:hypothetical protein
MLSGWRLELRRNARATVLQRGRRPGNWLSPRRMIGACGLAGFFDSIRDGDAIFWHMLVERRDKHDRRQSIRKTIEQFEPGAARRLDIEQKDVRRALLYKRAGLHDIASLIDMACPRRTFSNSRVSRRRARGSSSTT